MERVAQDRQIFGSGMLRLSPNDGTEQLNVDDYDDDLPLYLCIHELIEMHSL